MKTGMRVCTVFAAALSAATMWAQTAGQITPPKVLLIQREFVKPGKVGLHDKSESAFARAIAAKKWPGYYMAMSAMTGRDRVLFMEGFSSFAAWEEQNKALEKSGLLQTMNGMFVADGELLTESSQSLFTLDEEHSLNTGDVVHARYFNITSFRVKPGHRQEFLELAKMYKDGMAKVSKTANWALYECQFGENSAGYWLAISSDKTLAEEDQGMVDGDKFVAGMGSAGMKRIGELMAASVESSQTNLFEFSPGMSYPDPEWIKADPFWKPKAPAAAPAAAAAKKPDTK